MRICEVMCDECKLFGICFLNKFLKIVMGVIALGQVFLPKYFDLPVHIVL